MLAQIIEHAWVILPNMLAVLGAAVASTLVVSFLRGETTVFKNLYLVTIFVTGALNPILGIVGGSASVLVAHLKREWDQRELALLFTLLLLGIVAWFALL